LKSCVAPAPTTFGSTRRQAGMCGSPAWCLEEAIASVGEVILGKMLGVEPCGDPELGGLRFHPEVLALKMSRNLKLLAHKAAHEAAQFVIRTATAGAMAGATAGAMAGAMDAP
jgi:hypothetical protein